tara:strand:+ start:11412 stop:11609 length:198 start_codon:yes stop_codon:yes gene_type:complete
MMDNRTGHKRMAVVSIVWALFGYAIFLIGALTIPQYILPLFMVCYGWLLLGILLSSSIVSKYWND